MFKLNFVTPESRVVVNQDLEEISLPAERGELNILPGHAPLTTIVKPGILSYRLKSGEKAKLAVSWGYCQVSDQGVTVLAETAKLASDVNVKEDQDLLKTFESRLVNESLSDVDWDKVQREVKRLSAEIELASAR